MAYKTIAITLTVFEIAILLFFREKYHNLIGYRLSFLLFFVLVLGLLFVLFPSFIQSIESGSVTHNAPPKYFYQFFGWSLIVISEIVSVYVLLFY